MSENAQITLTGGLADNYCFQNWEQFSADFIASLTGTLPGEYSTIIIGSSTPGNEPNKPWLKLDGSNSPLGFRYLYNGNWVRVEPVPGLEGEVKFVYQTTFARSGVESFATYIARVKNLVTWLDEESSPTPPDTTATVANVSPFWRLCDGTNSTPNLLRKFIVGVGTGTPDLFQSTEGGEETHTLQETELPSHTHPLTNAKSYQISIDNIPGTVLGGNSLYDTGGAITATEATGGGLAHNNMPPYLALVPIIRTARRV